MKRDQLIGIWLSKAIFDYVDTEATKAGISRPELIRQILLNEFISIHAANQGLSAQQYIAHLIKGGQVGQLDQKLVEELIAANSNDKEVVNGEQQQHCC